MKPKATRQPRQVRRINCACRAALGLARRGFRIFPCRPNSKRPLIKDWPALATSDPDQIRHWWRSWPRANVAVACGGDARLMVLDVDPEAGGSISPSEIEGEHAVPASVLVTTPRKGTHIWLTVPEGRAVPRNSAGKLASGIDVRGEGGYCLVPPSTVLIEPGEHHRHWRLGVYRWSADSTDYLAEAPPWLLDRLDRPGNGELTDPAEWLTLVSSGVGEGQRNASIARIAGKLFRHLPAANAELVAELIACWNQVRARPPLDAEELATILNSIADRELARRGLS
jgi:hypothetical protein